MKKIAELTNQDIISWCEDFHKQSRSRQEILSDDEAQFLAVLIIEEDEFERDKEFIERLRKEFIYKVIEERLKLYSYKMTLSAMAALGLVFCNNLGQNTMNMTYLQYLSVLYKKPVIDVKFLCEKVFPFGKINKKVYDELWDNQKVDTTGVIGLDNMLDYPKIIEFIKSANL